VRLASGIPCALFYRAYEKFQQNSGAWRGEIAEARPVVIARHRVSPSASPMTGSCGGPSTPRLLGSIAGVSGMLGRPIKSGDDDRSSWLFEI